MASPEVMKLARETVRNLSAFDEQVNERIIARALEADRAANAARIEELEQCIARIKLAATGKSLSKTGLENALSQVRDLARSTLEGK